MNNIKLYLAIVVLMAAFSACSDEDLRAPRNEKGDVPAALRNVRIENLFGGARITYSLPPDDNILYVRAVYTIRDGYEREAKSSYHNNFLLLDGFPDTKEYEVKLYTVSRAEKESEPLTVRVNPLTPPVMETFESLKLAVTFGGISIEFENSSGADLALNVLASDSLGDLVPAEIFYTQQRKGTVAARGFNDEKRKFAVYVRDRWDNFSDTIFTEVTPLFEKELDKNNFDVLPLATDVWQANANTASRTLDKLWDGVIAGGNNSYTGPFLTFPSSFSIDLGAEAALSRFLYYPKATGSLYYVNSPRRFEIWGSNAPASDGSWESWTKLLDCEMIKPSGLPPGQFNDEDKAYSTAGIEFEFPPGIPKFKYIRFKTLDLWQGQHIEMFELTFFGSEK